jgi:hypothetical protein
LTTADRARWGGFTSGAPAHQDERDAQQAVLTRWIDDQVRGITGAVRSAWSLDT